MGFSKLRASYLIGVLAFAFWLSVTYYRKGLTQASLMSEATGIFSNIVFVGVLLMGFMVFMIGRTRKVF